MNIGIFVGYVLKPDSDELATNAEVALYGLQGDQSMWTFAGRDRGQYVEASTDDDGAFMMSVSWDGPEWSSGALTPTLLVAAYMVRYTSNSFQESALTRFRINAQVRSNPAAQIGLTMPDVQSLPGLASFAKDLIDAYRKMKAFPLPGVQYMSTENKLLLAAAVLRLKY